MKIRNIYSLAVFCLFSSGLSAQVGINTPNPQVTLDIVGNGSSTTIKDGLMPPRVSKQQLAAKVAGTYSASQIGSLVYVTDVTAPSGTTPSLSQVAQVSAIGYHQFDGTVWRVVSPEVLNIYNADGTLTGNRIVSQAANTLAFRGSAVNAFSVNNDTGTTNIFSVDGTNSRVGIGTTAPNGKFHVVSDAALANRYNLFDAAVSTNQYGILTLRNTSAIATGNYSLLSFTNNGPTVGGATWGIGSIRTGNTATNGTQEDFYIGNSNGGGLSERLRIASTTGNVGIGSSTPTRKLHVEGASYFNAALTTAVTKNAIDINIGQDGFGYGNRVDNYGINVRSSSTVGGGSVARINFGDTSTGTAGTGKYLSFSVGNGLNELMYLTDNNSGRVGIGTTAPTEKLHVIGNILASGTVTPSDIRIKKEIVDNGYGLNEILKLRTINYKYKDERLSKDKKVGFVAQEIQASMPELVSTANDEMKTLGVNYSEMTVVLTKAVQQQQELIKTQQAQIDQLQARLDKIESKQ